MITFTIYFVYRFLYTHRIFAILRLIKLRYLQKLPKAPCFLATIIILIALVVKSWTKCVSFEVKIAKLKFPANIFQNVCCFFAISKSKQTDTRTLDLRRVQGIDRAASLIKTASKVGWSFLIFSDSSSYLFCILTELPVMDFFSEVIQNIGH